MEGPAFATAINCIDGRIQIPVTEWMKKNLHVDYVDTITEPGVDKIWNPGSSDEVEAIKQKVMISLKAHGSTAVAVTAHHECAGNPVSEEEHLRLVQKGVEAVLSWGLPMRVLGLWVNDRWQVELVYDSQKK